MTMLQQFLNSLRKKKYETIYQNLLAKTIAQQLLEEEFQVYRNDMNKFIPMFRSIFEKKSLEALQAYQSGNIQELLDAQSAGRKQKNQLIVLTDLIMSRYLDPENEILRNLEKEHQVLFTGKPVGPFEKFYLKRMAVSNLSAIPLHKIKWHHDQSKKITKDDLDNFLELIDAVSGPNTHPSQVYWTLKDEHLPESEEQLIDFFRSLSEKGVRTLYTPSLTDEAIDRLITLSQRNGISLLFSDERVDTPMIDIKQEVQRELEKENRGSFDDAFELLKENCKTVHQTAFNFFTYLKTISDGFSSDELHTHLDYSDEEFQNLAERKFFIDSLLFSLKSNSRLYVNSIQIENQLKGKQEELVQFLQKVWNDFKAQREQMREIIQNNSQLIQKAQEKLSDLERRIEDLNKQLLLLKTLQANSDWKIYDINQQIYNLESDSRRIKYNLSDYTEEISRARDILSKEEPIFQWITELKNNISTIEIAQHTDQVLKKIVKIEESESLTSIAQKQEELKRSFYEIGQENSEVSKNFHYLNRFTRFEKFVYFGNNIQIMKRDRVNSFYALLRDKIYFSTQEGFILDLSNFERIENDSELNHRPPRKAAFSLMLHQLSILGCHTIYLNEKLQNDPDILKMIGDSSISIIYKKPELELIHKRKARWDEQLQKQLEINPDFLTQDIVIQPKKEEPRLKTPLQTFEGLAANIQDLGIEIETEAEAEAETETEAEAENEQEQNQQQEYQQDSMPAINDFYYNDDNELTNGEIVQYQAIYNVGRTRIIESSLDYLNSKTRLMGMEAKEQFCTKSYKHQMLPHYLDLIGIDLKIDSSMMITETPTIEERFSNIRLLNQERGTDGFSGLDQLAGMVVKNDHDDFSIDALPHQMQDKIYAFLKSSSFSGNNPKILKNFIDSIRQERIEEALEYRTNWWGNLYPFRQSNRVSTIVTSKNLAVLFYLMSLPEENEWSLSKIKKDLTPQQYNNFLIYLSEWSGNTTKISTDLLYLLKLKATEYSYQPLNDGKDFIKFLKKFPKDQIQDQAGYIGKLEAIEFRVPYQESSGLQKEKEKIIRIFKKYDHLNFQAFIYNYRPNLEGKLNFPIRFFNQLFELNIINQMYTQRYFEELDRLYQEITQGSSYTLQKKINHFLFQSIRNSSSVDQIDRRLTLLSSIRLIGSLEVCLDIGYSVDNLEKILELNPAPSLIELIKQYNLTPDFSIDLLSKLQNINVNDFCAQAENKQIISTLFCNSYQKSKDHSVPTTKLFVETVSSLKILKEEDLFLYQQIEKFLEPNKQIDKSTLELIKQLAELTNTGLRDSDEELLSNLHQKINIKFLLDSAKTIAEKIDSEEYSLFIKEFKEPLIALSYGDDVASFKRYYEAFQEKCPSLYKQLNELHPSEAKKVEEPIKIELTQKGLLDFWVLATAGQERDKSKEDLKMFRSIIARDVEREKDVIERLNEISTTSQRDQGELGLLKEEKMLLISMIKRFQSLVNSSFFETAGVEELREKYRENRKKLSNLSKDSKEFHEIYLETLAICSFMCMKNPSFGFAPKLTQISSVLLQLFHPRQVHEIATGEGKTLIMALHVMMSYAQGTPVEYITSAPNLAQQTEESMRPILELLNIPCVRLVESKDAIPNEGVVISDINTRILCSLQETGTGIDKKYEDVRQLAHNKKFLVDEWDYPFYDIKTDFKIPESIFDLKGMKYDALYKIIADLDLSSVENKKAFIREKLRGNIQDLYGLRLRPSKKEIRKYNAKINNIADYILEDLIEAKRTAEILKAKGLGQAYAITEIGDKVKYARPVLDGLIQYDSNFSLHVQQFLHYYLQQEDPESSFVIPAPKEINSIHTVDTFMRYIMQEGSLVGVTGTIGSSEERKEIQHRYPGTVFIGLPTYEASKRSLSKELECDTEEDYVNQINAEIDEYIQNRPAYLVCDNDSKKTSLWFSKLKERYQDTSIQICDERGRSTDGINFEPWSDREYSKMKDFAAQPGNISVVTVGIGGRGIDITVIGPDGQPSDLGIGVIIADQLSERSERQALGRTGRQGREGVYSKITLKSEKLSKKEDQYYIIEKRIIRDSFDFVSRHQLFKASWSPFLKKLKKESNKLKAQGLDLKTYEQKLKKLRNQQILEFFNLRFKEPSSLKMSHSLDKKVLKSLNHSFLTTTQQVEKTSLDFGDSEHYRQVVFIDKTAYLALSIDQQEKLKKAPFTKVIFTDEKTLAKLDWMSLANEIDPQTNIHLIGEKSLRVSEDLLKLNLSGRAIHLWPGIKKLDEAILQKGAYLYSYNLTDRELPLPLLAETAIDAIHISGSSAEEYYATLLGCNITCSYQNQDAKYEQVAILEQEAIPSFNQSEDFDDIEDKKLVKDYELYQCRQFFIKKELRKSKELINKLKEDINKLDRESEDFDIEAQVSSIDIEDIMSQYYKILETFSTDRGIDVVSEEEKTSLERDNINITDFLNKTEKELILSSNDEKDAQFKIEELRKFREALLKIRVQHLLKDIPHQEDIKYEQITKPLIKAIEAHFESYESIKDKNTLNRLLSSSQIANNTGSSLQKILSYQKQNQLLDLIDRDHNEKLQKYFNSKIFGMNDELYDHLNEDEIKTLIELIQSYGTKAIRHNPAFENIASLYQSKLEDPYALQWADYYIDRKKPILPQIKRKISMTIQKLRNQISIYDQMKEGKDFSFSFQDCFEEATARVLKEGRVPSNDIFTKNGSFRRFVTEIVLKQKLNEKLKDPAAAKRYAKIGKFAVDAALYLYAAYLYIQFKLIVGFYKMMDRRIDEKEFEHDEKSTHTNSTEESLSDSDEEFSRRSKRKF